ncbi:hypothetical protein [Deinococcus cavernae]|uniref:hypothetical protein n=1 Tax=Deinococcus cavernae TaxID=2320857 RepID=UPI001F414B40|nr:hypothetical protein [Deinococcus cavernae]
MLVTLAAGLTAYLLLSGVRSYPGVVATGLIFMGTAAAAFPQVFAFARVSLTGAPGDLPSGP